MRTLIFLLCIAVLPGNVVQAEEPDPGVYGTPLEITIPVDIDSLWENYKIDRTKENYRLFQQWDSIDKLHLEQVWSPDGKWIAFTGFFHDFIYIVPADGGVPEVIFYDYQYDIETKYYFNTLMNFCFTPDSQEVTFTKFYYDEERGSIVDITIKEDGGVRASFSKPILNIESVNIYTGEHRFLTEGEGPSWSHDGRYLCYLNFDYRINIDELQADHHGAVTVLDTETGEKWFLTDGSQECGYPQFTPDDQTVIVSMTIGEEKTVETPLPSRTYHEYQLFRIPVNRGEPEQITFYDSEGDGTGEVRYGTDISPDGEWIIYDDNNYQNFYIRSSGNGPTKHLCLYNLKSGETYKIFPEPQDTNIYGYSGKFSPDGTKICYGLRDYNSRETNGPFIYIMDINLEQYAKTVYVEAEQPSSFALLSNYPNPFNLSTTIEFTLPEGGFTELVIYNISGQKIRELVSVDMTPGVHSVVWDGRDENGTPVSSGIFISRLKNRDNVFSNRMMLVK